MDLNQNVVHGDAVKERKPSAGNDPLLEACEEFFRINKIWTEANPEGALSESTSQCAEDHWRLAVQRDKILVTIKTLTPTGIPSLIEKGKVLREMVRWKAGEDEMVVEFSLNLIENYNSLFLGNCSDKCSHSITALPGVNVTKGAEDKRSWRSNLHNMFGIFNH